jgi:hypothetical protein
MEKLVLGLVVPVVLAVAADGLREPVAQHLLPVRVMLAVLEQITSVAFMVAAAGVALAVQVLAELLLTGERLLLALCPGLLFTTRGVAAAGA